MEIQELIMPKNLENLQLPDPGLLDYYNLAENRIFYIDYEIDMGILDVQRNIVLINIADKDIPIEERIPIKILIDSPGGLLSETMSVASTIIQSKTPVITINMADAYSGAAILLMAGHKRYAMPYSKAMLHTGSGGTSGTFEQTEEQQKNYKRQVEDMGKFILARTGMDEKVFKRNKTKDWYMMPEDQLKYGLVHEIVDNVFDILI
jgi:ATP-dependent Clp protease protease subunit